ncbi:MAG: hypothetical protein ABI806_10765 [Candidatus Solibacter sp.]
MRFLPAFLIAVAGFAQLPAQQPAPQPKPAEAPAKADDQAKPAEAAPAKADEKAASPAPSSEQWFTGSFDFGYRWVGDVRGSEATYRSFVNLGDGPKLTGLDFTITDPKHRLFDRIDARANAWGGDPYNTAHIQVTKRGIYDLTGDYRNIAYFNALPSFANPLAPRGFNERAFDTHRRSGVADLRFFPGKHVMPYLVYERNSGYGHGIETWVQDANNEFSVPLLLRDSTNNYRGGLHVEFNRWHVTLEEGGTTYKDDNQATFSGTHYGDRTTPLLGTTSLLTNLRQTYGTRGTSTYSKVMATANPFHWMDLYGQYLYSNPTTDTRYFDLANGNFALLSSLLLYSTQYNIGASSATAPHTVGNAGVEIRPFKHLRIVESLTTDRYANTNIGTFTEQILLAPGSTYPALTMALSLPQSVNYNRQQVEAIWDITSRISLRYGYRYEWGDSSVRAGVLDQSGPYAAGELKRNVFLYGLTVRPWQKLSFNIDHETGTTDRNYFRTGLHDYTKVRARAKYQALASLWFQANFTFLDNQNPTPGIRYDFRSRDNSMAVNWAPGGGKHVSVMAEYNRSTLYSSVDFLLLPFYTPSVSVYRDNAHTASSMIDISLPAIGGVAAKLSAGGSLFISAGSRATRYYQPLGRLSLPLQKHVQWNTEWRYYGYGEPMYQYEGFRTHIFMTGFRLSK